MTSWRWFDTDSDAGTIKIFDMATGKDISGSVVMFYGPSEPGEFEGVVTRVKTNDNGYIIADPKTREPQFYEAGGRFRWEYRQ